MAEGVHRRGAERPDRAAAQFSGEVMRLPRPADAPFLPPVCPYCGKEMIRHYDLVDPLAMVSHIVRICRHMIECSKRGGVKT